MAAFETGCSHTQAHLSITQLDTESPTWLVTTVCKAISITKQLPLLDRHN